MAPLYFLASLGAHFVNIEKQRRAANIEGFVSKVLWRAVSRAWRAYLRLRKRATIGLYNHYLRPFCKLCSLPDVEELKYPRSFLRRARKQNVFWQFLLHDACARPSDVMSHANLSIIMYTTLVVHELHHTF